MNKEKKKNTDNTMRHMFKGYSFYSEKEYKDIWDNGIIVVDTNILLNLYRYSNESRNEILKLLKNLNKRIWIPYQVAKEYFKNRDKIINDSSKEFEKLKDQIEKSYNDIDNVLKNKEKNYTEIKEIEKIVKKSKENIDKEFAKMNNSATQKESSFDIESEILDLIHANIGPKYSEEEYEKMIEEGEKRINNKIPPGYKDGDKKERYKEKPINGDYIVFKSFLNYAKENNKNIIFITDDVKEDWFQEINGEKKGGRPELLQEFYEETGNLLLIYSFEGFANKFSELDPKNKLSEDVISEIYEINTSDAEKLFKYPIKDMLSIDEVLEKYEISSYFPEDNEINDKNKKAVNDELYIELKHLKRIIARMKSKYANINQLYNQYRHCLRIILHNIPDKDSFIKDEIKKMHSDITIVDVVNDKAKAIFMMEAILETLEEYYYKNFLD